jgi:catechol 2,3-dioxygenase-like lactoylglutathione lyase family enzyme
MPGAAITATCISHVSLRVSDIARAVKWYQSALGYDVLSDGPAPTPDRTRSMMGLICGGALRGRAFAHRVRHRLRHGVCDGRRPQAHTGDRSGRLEGGLPA